MLPSVLPRLATDSAVRVSWCLGTSILKIPFPGRSSLPTSFVSFFIFYIFSYLILKTMICFSGCLMSSASIQKFFCEVYSALKCSFDEFVREKVVSPSYFSAILGPPPIVMLLSSVQFSHSAVSDSSRPHESQHARPPSPSPSPKFIQTHIHRVHDAIQSSHPLSSPSPPAPNPFQHQSLFQ